MNQTKKYLMVLLIILALGMFWWINKIESPSRRVLGILMVSVTAYWVGRLHEKICLTGTRADGMDSFGSPPFLN